MEEDRLTGKYTWDLTLAPSEVREIAFSYAVEWTLGRELTTTGAY